MTPSDYAEFERALGRSRAHLLRLADDLAAEAERLDDPYTALVAGQIALALVGHEEQQLAAAMMASAAVREGAGS